MIEEIKQMLTNSQYDQKTQNELVCAIEKVNNLLKMNKKLQLKSFERQVDVDLMKIKEMLIELQLKIKKSSRLLSFLRLDKYTIDLQSQIKLQLLDLQNQVQSYYNAVNCDTDTIEFQVLEFNHIRQKLQFMLYHPKFDPIGIIIEFVIFESSQQNDYQMIIQHNYLIQKFKQYFEKQLFEKFQTHKLKNQNETALFTLMYNFSEKYLFILVENDPYIVTSNQNQSKIYLDKDMLLIFENFYQLKVIHTNTQNINKQQLSSSNQNKLNKYDQIIKVNGYGYIQFEYINLKNKKVEFYLKDSNLDLSNHLQGIQAILYHDCNGFYIIPKPNGNPYKIIYHQKLITKDPLLNFGIQLQNKFWIEVEIDKKKSDYLILN